MSTHTPTRHPLPTRVPRERADLLKPATRNPIPAALLLNLAGLLLIVLGSCALAALLWTVDWRLPAGLLSVLVVAAGYALATKDG